MQIPQKLLARLKALDIDESIYDRRTRKCILSKDEMNEKVPWHENAYYIGDNLEKKDRFVFDPVSLVPCLALKPGKDDRILDMCAAPGTKTFILCFLTGNAARINANDIDRTRIRRLASNVNKFGLNCEIKNVSGRKIEGSFNKILLDAPCSGEGMVNKKEKLFRHWSEKRVKAFSSKQKKLIKHAFEMLEEGGVLVYSTCTFEPEENECVIDFLLHKNKNAELEEIKLNIRHVHGLAEWDNKVFCENMKKCMRIYPNHNDTSGFFVAKIRKT